MRLIYVCLTLLALATTSLAAEWVQRGSHFFKNGVGQPHVRTRVDGGYWTGYGCNRYYQATYHYEYEPVLKLDDPDFFIKALDVVKSRDEYNAKVKVLEALGYAAPSSYQRLDIYGQVPTYFNPKYAEPLDANALLQNYMLAVKASGEANAVALSGAQALAFQVAEEANRQQKFILAVKAIEELYQKPLATVVQEVRIQAGVRALSGNHPAVIKDGSCLSCHSGPKPAGKLDLSSWSIVSGDDKVRAAGAILTGAMPPAEAVKAGKAKAVDKSRAREVFE